MTSMAVNVEIKARLRDIAAVEIVAERLASAPPATLSQEDVLFECGSGRLKLRLLSRGRGELIAYKRMDSPGPRMSSYCIYETPDPSTLRMALSRALGERVVVRKERRLYVAGHREDRARVPGGIVAAAAQAIRRNSWHPKKGASAIGTSR